YFHYTVGQRKGLDIKTPAKDGSPRYVLRTDSKTNTVIVGSKFELEASVIYAKENTVYENDFSKCSIQIRAHSKPILAQKKIYKGKTFEFILDDVQPDGVSGGQTLVAYNNDKVLGSYTIVNELQKSKTINEQF
ncbi:MAG: hypothetical protein LBB10_01990, partial [Bifidobacteriaceae bacterium]|nr:hypothetical protein [Bifidobacteriaceae bacterium]